MAELTYDDFKNRINIQDLLVMQAISSTDVTACATHRMFVWIATGNVSVVISLSSQAMGYAAFNRQKSRTIM